MSELWYYFKLDCKEAPLVYWEILVWLYRRLLWKNF